MVHALQAMIGILLSVVVFVVYMTHSGKRRLLGSNLENKLMLWADSAQNDV
jgi:hypothetical protein